MTMNGSRDEALLEYTVGGDAAEPSMPSSPRLDATEINNNSLWPSNASSFDTMPSQVLNMAVDQNGINIEDTAEQYSSFHHRDLEQESPLDWPWPWLFEETGASVYQTGDPAIFWSQLQ